jgi:hypothetical protein
MIHTSNFHANADALSDADRAGVKARAQRLLAGIYRSVGLAAIANEFSLPPDDFDPELHKAVKRCARYLYLAAAPDGAWLGQ